MKDSVEHLKVDSESQN